jgi:hypothetical protein
MLLLCCCPVQRVCWYQGSRHLAVLRADFESQQFSISHTPYRAPKAADEEAEETELQTMAWWQGTRWGRLGLVRTWGHLDCHPPEDSSC